jgi:hypothetical protein
MKSRWILNIALAAIIAALAALVYFRPGSEKPAGPPLTALTAEQITRVRIERGAQTIVLEKTGAAWRLTAPVQTRANQFNIDSLLRLASATSSFQAPVEANAATYGLDQPALRLRLNDEEIAVGAIHPMRQQHYVRYRDTVHLIPSYVLTAAFQNYGSFIDTQLLDGGRRLTALRLPTFRLELKDGTWQRVPADSRLSTDRLNSFVAEWENARALSVAKLSAKPTRAQVQLTFDQDGERATLMLDILATKPEFILARRDERLEYHFPEDVGKRLLTLAAE